MSDYKYYGDEWLKTHDITNQLSLSDAIMMNITSQGMIELIPPFEIAYLTGAKKDFMKQCAFIAGVNRVIQSDPKKYIQIFKDKDRRIPIAFMENGQIQQGPPKRHNMFQ